MMISKIRIFFRIIFDISKSFRKKIFFLIPKFCFRKKNSFYDLLLGLRLFDGEEFKNYVSENLKLKFSRLKFNF